MLEMLITEGHQNKKEPFMIDLIPAFEWDLNEEEASSYACSLMSNFSSGLEGIVVGVRDRSYSDTDLAKISYISPFATMPGHKFLTESHELKEESLERANLYFNMVDYVQRSNLGHRFDLAAVQPNGEESKGEEEKHSVS